MNDYKALAKHFDNIFHTNTAQNVDFNNRELLKTIYSHFEEKFTTPNEEYKELLHQCIDISTQLREILSADQKALLDKYSELNSAMQSIELEQIFIFGYIVAKQLDLEAE